MRRNRPEVLAGSLLCILFAVLLFGWMIEPVLESALKAAK
jgi:hypothetical protein